jgi:prepilin-type N-terminal cleavage/methylation domain-containing protein
MAGYSLLELLVVVAIVGVISAIAVPMMSNTLGDFRLRGDARGLTNSVSLAKLRSASNFTQARLFVNLSTNSFRVETWQKTGTPAWVVEGGTTALAQYDQFSPGVVSTPPPNTQSTILQAPGCFTGLNGAGTAVANSACVLFNSRGIPIDTSGAPTAANALYITDGTAIYGVTLSATGLIQLWRTGPAVTPTWVLQ